MHYIVITDSTKRKRLLMLDSPYVKAAKTLHEHDLGKLKEISTKLQNLPAWFGPISDKSQAEHMVSLLTGTGLVCEIRQHNDT